MYLGTDAKTHALQWNGWHEYIRGYSQRPNFQAAWKLSGSTYDMRFQEYMERTMALVTMSA